MPYELDDVVELLNAKHQRATYGAMTVPLGYRDATSARAVGKLLAGYQPCHFYSWVVRKDTWLPAEYLPAQIHPDLWNSGPPIDDPYELRRWLDLGGTFVVPQL
jgi:hypothetical protein